MSHFTVAVFTKTGTEEEVDRLLAPYQENSMEDCPKEVVCVVFPGVKETRRGKHISNSRALSTTSAITKTLRTL